jgi:DNA repair protein RadD
MTAALTWYFQEEGVDATINYFYAKSGNPIGIFPTATGKGRIIAKLVKKILSMAPNERLIVSTFSKELILQNFLEFKELCPEISCGLYSAGLNKRDTYHQVIFCGIQSAYKKASIFGHRGLLIVDEVQAVPKEGEGMWLTFIKGLKQTNQYLKCIGFSATAYRMDSGMLIDGENRIFTDICYEYPLLKAIQEGYVCELIPKRMTTKYDLSQVHKRGGEYMPGELERAVDIDEKNHTAVDEIVEMGKDRKSWLVFAAGNDHAKALYAEISGRGIKCALVLQDTPDAERDRAVRDIKNFNIQCLINNLIFTTGFNAKNIDLIACFRATQSEGLWTQICGRGFRLYPDKANCLMLDYTDNAGRHGPLDLITGRRGKEKGTGGEAPMRVCPKCQARCFAGCSECPDCAYVFPVKELDILKSSSESAILSTQILPETYDVIGMIQKFHSARIDPDNPKIKPPTMCVTYSTMTGPFKEWVCFSHPPGYARDKAIAWHKERSDLPVPNTVEEALQIKYPCPTSVTVRKKDKFWEVLSVDFTKKEHIEIEEENILATCEDF